MKWQTTSCLVLLPILIMSTNLFAAAIPEPAVQSLDGEWKIAEDPKDTGKTEKWFEAATFPVDAAARSAQVPGAITDAWPDTRIGTAPPTKIDWYMLSFTPAMSSARPQMRYYLRFGAVKETCEVWFNGVSLGAHDGGEDPFEFDVTRSLHVGQSNAIVLRVLSGAMGGINQHIALAEQPDVRIIDAFAKPDVKGSQFQLEVTIENNTDKPAQVNVAAALSELKPAKLLETPSLEIIAPPGQSVAHLVLPVAHPHLWDLNDPFLYSVRVTSDWKGGPGDAYSFHTGLRDFRMVNGYFTLNGRRIYIKSAHGNYYDPIHIQGTPGDMTWLGQDFPQLKKGGFNMMRNDRLGGVFRATRASGPTRVPYFLAEHETSWQLHDPPRFGLTLNQVVRRDRNHPSLVLWGASQ